MNCDRVVIVNSGVDVILDYIGGDYANKNIKLLRRDGRMVIIGFLKGPHVHFLLSLSFPTRSISRSTLFF